MGVRARWAVGLVLPAALLLGLAACSAPGEPAQDAPTAVVVGAADCLASQVLADLGLVAAGASGGTGTPHADAPEAGRVPDGFLPVSVVVCAAGRHPAGLVRDVGGADREPARGGPGPARRGAAPAVGTAWRDVQQRGGRGAVPLAGRRPRSGDPAGVADGPLRRPRSRRCRPRWTRSRRPTASSTRSGSWCPRSRRADGALSPRACAAGPAPPRGRCPWSARGWRGCGWAGCSAARLGWLIESQIRSARSTASSSVSAAYRWKYDSGRANAVCRSARNRSTYQRRTSLVRAST